MSVIDVRELTRSFVVYRKAGRWRRTRSVVRAVDAISFTIERGEMVGYIGPNGAGKSTTIKMLTGILVPSSGHLRVAGFNPAAQRVELARRIGVVFGQRTTLWWDLPLRDSFLLLRRIYRIPDSRFRTRLAELVDLLDLATLLDVPVRQLSVGQRMRGDIVAALLHSPEILYLDEPTVGLDVVSKARLRAFLRQINTETAVTVLLTTHDLTDIEQLCSRVMVIDHGRMAYDGPLTGLQSLGGGERTLIVDLVEPGPPVSVDGVTVARVDGTRQWLTFPAETSAAAVVSALAARYPLADLSIQEPTIEDVISRLYAGKPVPNATA